MSRSSIAGNLLPLALASPGIWGLWYGETWFPAGRGGYSIQLTGMAGQVTACTWIALGLVAHLRLFWYPSMALRSGYQITETALIVGTVGGLLFSLYLMFGQIFSL